MTTLLDDYALISPLRNRNNWLKLIIVAFGLLVGVSSTSPVTPLFIALSMSIATVFLGKTPLKLYLKILTAPLGFAFAGAVVIFFFFGSGSEILSFNIFGYPFIANSEGINMATLVVSRTFSGMCCLFFLAFTTPMVELFAVLKKTRLPESFIELSMLIYRYIFVFLDVAMSIKYAQTIRLGYKDVKSSIYSFSMLVSTLFLQSWEQGEKLYLAMDSRCYNGKMMMFDAKRPVELSEIITASLYFIFILTIFYFTKNISVV
ncbi:cobalt ECF transporter T component CbiQ [Methanohalobium sp.]|uniref:cobalt ECF transporter T component CbiQ n=1 Tax=Methanohalobium sp. TaxID=2837493 RepID=UPI0025EF546A|nr:cobalt ECF transporter T component CbiQ [Methanohalobium sp.]